MANAKFEQNNGLMHVLFQYKLRIEPEPIILGQKKQENKIEFRFRLANKSMIQKRSNTVLFFIVLSVISVLGQIKTNQQATQKPYIAANRNLQQNIEGKLTSKKENEVKPLIGKQFERIGDNQPQQQLKQLVETIPQIKSRDFKKIKTPLQFNQAFQNQLKKWSQFSEVINATPLSNGRQICQNSQPCQFFYYVIPRKCLDCYSIDLAGNGNSNIPKTVFLTSGMHGNQYLGPHALLYSLRHILQSPYHPRIVIFPLANPSGFLRNQRLTYPTNVDPNRDFPLEQQNKCYKASSTKIIDTIFRFYKIDLTIGIHNGGNQIGWNWGTKKEKSSSHTADYKIYSEIGLMMHYLAGSNENIKMKELKAGTMTQVIYPATNTFDDWAYAASWYYDPKQYAKRAGNSSRKEPPLMPSPSPTCDYSPYPETMTNGLVFLLQVGPFNTPEASFGTDQGVYLNPQSKSSKNGFISRVIRMILSTLDIVESKLEIKFTKTNAYFKLQGCKQGQLQQMSMKSLNVNTNQVILAPSRQAYQIKGTINPFEPQILSITLQNQLQSIQVVQQDDKPQDDLRIQIEYVLECDSEWERQGETIFADKRGFTVNKKLKITGKDLFQRDTYQKKNYYESQKQALLSFKLLKSDQNTDYLQDRGISTSTVILVVTLIIIFILVVCFFRVICKEVINNRKKRAIQKKVRQYQVGEIKLDTENDDEKLDQSEDQIVNEPQQKYPEFCDSEKGIQSSHPVQSPAEQQFIQLQQFVRVSQMVYENHR